MDNQALIEDFRSHGGEITDGFFKGRRLLLLTTVGAKSGREMVAPLAFTEDGERYLVAASMGGAPRHPSWYHNLLKNPEVTVELGAEKFHARATAVPGGPQRRELYDRHAAEKPGFLDYEKKTSREIPIVILERIP